MTNDERHNLRMLILDNEFPPLGGGTGVVNYQLMRELECIPGIQYDLVTSSRTPRTFEKEQWGEHGRIFKVPVDNHNIHHSTNRELLRYTWRGLICAYNLARKEPYDVCLAFSTVPAGAMALMLRLLTGLPYIVSLQGPDVPGFEQRYAGIYPLLTPLIKLVWAYSAGVTAISEEHRKLALRSMPQCAIEIIPNGVDAGLFVPATPEQGPATTSFTVLCVGRLIERKGQHHLLEAMHILNTRGYTGKICVVLVGTGDMETQLREQCGRLGLNGTVEFAGFKERSEMPHFYQQANIFVLPSFNEGMSIALLEAMSAGLPVIVTDTGGTAELLHGNGKIIPWASPLALADAIEFFLCQPKLCKVMGQMSREIATSFGWSAFATRYLQLCNKVIGDRLDDTHAPVTRQEDLA
jgi:phosphatidyl-myo-inositol dimannoside synthase